MTHIKTRFSKVGESGYNRKKLSGYPFPIGGVSLVLTSCHLAHIKRDSTSGLI